MSGSKFYHFSREGIFYNTGSPEKALMSLKEGGFVWFDFFEPSKEDLTALMDTLGIHPLSIEDCLDERQVPKIEHFPKNTFIIFNAFTYIEKNLHIDEVDLFIGENFLVTVCGVHSDKRKPINNIDSTIENEIENVKKGPAYLMHVILDHIVDQKFLAIDKMEDELEEAEEFLLDSPDKFNPGELV